MPDPSRFIDLERYPVSAPTDDPAGEAVIAHHREALARDGVALLPGFLTPAAVAETAAMVDLLRPRAHLEDAWGTAYLGLPEDGYADDHPRRTVVHSLTWVLAFDLVPADCPVRLVYEWDALRDWLGRIIDRGPLYRMDDPLGALNLSIMEEDHVQGWHYDSTDFVVSVAIRASDAGGDFECAPHIRDHDDEHYDRVAEVLAGEGGEQLVRYPMTPGTLMLFEGRRSIHRVSPVVGATSRIVALLGYDNEPGTTSSDILKLVRYGRTEPIPTGAG